MKTLIFFGLCTIATSVLGQTPCACCNTILETPAVLKPTNPDILSVTCNTLTVKWKGNVHQTYTVNAIYKQAGFLPQNIEVTDITCDNGDNCTATIPVIPGTLVSWGVQAMAVIDDRTFSSYPLRGDQDYLIPSCGQPVAVTEKAAASGTTSSSKEQLVVSNEKLAMYPNPVNDALNVKLSSEYKGSMKLTVIDVSGKTVIAMDAEKQQADYYNRISVNTLKPGIYIMNVHMQNGKYFATKFLKN